MTENRFFWPGVAFTVGLLVIGVGYWPVAYADVSLPNSLMGPGLLVALGAAAPLRGWARAPFWLSFVAAVGELNQRGGLRWL